MTTIDRFTGRYEGLSNFAWFEVFYDGYWFPTVEHAFQAAKTTDPSDRLFIGMADTPKQAKAMGRKVELRDNWDRIRYAVMRSLLLWKFTQHAFCRNLLLATGEARLVEGNYWHDNYWGDCYCARCIDTPGENVLGRLLMLTRVDIG